MLLFEFGEKREDTGQSVDGNFPSPITKDALPNNRGSSKAGSSVEGGTLLLSTTCTKYEYLLPDLAWKMKAFSSSGNRMRWSRLINASFLDEGSAQHDVFGQHAMQIR